MEINPTSPKKGDVVTLKPVPRTGYRLDSLKVLDRSGKEVPVTKQADGSFTYTQPAGRVTVKAVFVAATAADIFDDVASNAWYAQSVDYVLDRGLMAGTSANTFSPEMPTSRGMLSPSSTALPQAPDKRCLLLRRGQQRLVRPGGGLGRQQEHRGRL